MKNMVIILVQPLWSEWQQNCAIRSSRRDFQIYINKLDNDRWASGRGGLNRYKLLDYKEVRDWLSDRYIELRGAYKIRMTYAEFQPLVMSRGIDLGDEWAVRRRWNPRGHSLRHGWGYTQNPEHKPKDRPTEDPWYVENHHKKDKARAGNNGSCSGRKFWVKQAARDHRAWVKRQLKAENWDAFGLGADDSEYIINPWLWD